MAKSFNKELDVGDKIRAYFTLPPTRGFAWHDGVIKAVTPRGFIIETDAGPQLEVERQYVEGVDWL